MMLAVMVREAVTAIGSPSGMNATATDTQSTIKIGTVIQPGCDLRSHEAQTITTIRIIVTIRQTMMATKIKISFCRGVRPAFGALVSFAMRPNTVRSPVSTTRPQAWPETQCVPAMPMQAVSR